MIRLRRVQLITMLLVIGFWVAVIFGLLFFPNPFTLFSSQPTINVYSWTELIDQHKVAEFQKKTGIKVNVGYFESNEELFAKVRLTRGEGYDLIVPSDYMAENFIKEKGFLQKIDRSKLDFWNRLNRNLLGQYFDPQNEYSIPYMWSIYGIGINKKNFDEAIKKDWSLLFDPNVSHANRVLIDDMRELMTIAAYYKFGSIDNLTEQKMEILKHVLLKQKKYVLAYTEGSAPYLLATNQASLALVTSPYVLRIIEHNKDIDFVIPEGKPIVAIDTLVIPASSKKQDLVYQFINFLFTPDVVKYHVDQTYFFPAVSDVPCREIETSSKKILDSCGKQIRQFRFLRNVIPSKIVNEFWLFLKS